MPGAEDKARRRSTVLAATEDVGFDEPKWQVRDGARDGRMLQHPLRQRQRRGFDRKRV